MPDVAVLREKVRRMEVELQDIRSDLKDQGKELDDLVTSKETMLIKLDQIQKQIGEIQTTVQADAGWRGFFLDFIKAAAQIAVLVGAGKWIF